MSRRFFTDTALPPRNNIFYYAKEFAQWTLFEVPKYLVGKEDVPDLYENDEDFKLAQLDSKRNTITTEQYVYTALPDPTDSCKCIRVLELLPGTRQDDIACRLVQEKLREGLKYEALSYVWGDITETTPVQVGNLTLHIGKSLRSALLDLRHAEKSRFIWADAICIDQQNIHERAKQVGVMGDIYTQATRTVVWLGPYYEYAYVAFDCINKVERDALTHEQSLTKTGSTPTNSSIEASQSKEEREKMRHGFYMLYELVETKDWWKRAWVVQEVLLASEKIIMCGRRETDWKKFITAFEYGRRAEKFDLSNIMGIPTDDVFRGLRTIRELEVKPPEGNVAAQLLRLLILLRPRLATNPRDKVYAIMGLFKQNRQDLNIVPDYTASVEDVYCTVATAILRGTEGLDLLSCCIEDLDPGAEKKNLPSWVPDWSISETSCIPLIQDSPDVTRHYRATNKSKALVEFFHEPYVLGVTGQVLDEIIEYSDMLKFVDGPDPDYQEAEDPSLGRTFLEAGYELMGVYRALLEVVDFYDVFLTWETVADSEPCYVYKTKEVQSSKKMFWQTLCTGLLDTVDEEVAEKLFREWRSKLAPISGLRRMKASKFATLFKTLGLMGYFWTTWNSFGAFSKMIPHTRSRRIGRTKSGWLCLLPSGVKAGDQLVLLRGAMVPFVVRDRGDGYWTLVGEAYVHGIMNGEAHDEAAGISMKFK